MNKIYVEGTVTSVTIEQKNTAKGPAYVCHLCVLDENEYGKTYYRTTAWRENAHKVYAAIKKDDKVNIYGVLVIRPYTTKAGVRSFVAEIEKASIYNLNHKYPRINNGEPPKDYDIYTLLKSDPDPKPDRESEPVDDGLPF